MSDVKIIRLQTGEDVIAKIAKDSVGNYTLEKSFVIIPTQAGPGKPVSLMMTPYMPYTDDERVIISAEKVVTQVTPKNEILKSYQQNTSSILTPTSELITESKLPKF